ncbi:MULTISPECIES: glycine--tRNA ligase [unclassified Sporosarcina]|uniref:glycine--tRNA ligase n=1 Tax=unclassified Sporosarcina TaxID=2647733 RepID=UPI000C16E7EC|nr:MULTISPECIES: glycine--tRNA ligase [unclassified Sporosarcina]PID00453.1 glycine--tRNA ligase [Sporosarcina sp. P29]PID05742.1 glycine--tRNA ligase [Sporosarcina sp. P30]PID08936.1 glycine--tRNA ligase [Sporosarcina sp. P31]PID12022.1 glycine--tRNA ligase [Sporosarcina sp. P32b]
MLSMEQVVNLSKQRGFVFPGSDIYGGLANTWDYGPLGVELKNNIKRAWWQKFIQESPYNVGLDSAILMNPKVWEASGHIGNFNDPMIDCKKCNTRHRADKLIEEALDAKGIEMVVDGLPFDKMFDLIQEHEIKCPTCGALDYTEIRQFNLMFKTSQGVTDSSANEIFLRPETAQGIFVNFKNVQRSMRKKVPFGIAQVGKSFRNEITPGNFTFRTREFEQMELEFFCKPGEDEQWYKYWIDQSEGLLLNLGLKKDNIRLREHNEDELSHYSKGTVDIEYKFPFGWGELWGIANRTDFDLKRHMEYSGEDFHYQDPITNEKYVPYCIEPSVGADRVTLAFLCDAFDTEELEDGDTRTVLRFHPALAPIKAAVLPLSKKLADDAQKVYAELSKHFPVQYDDSQSIGRRYRRQDEIGTPFCITFDFDSLEDQQVTVRHRDSMEQERMPIADVTAYIQKHLQF